MLELPEQRRRPEAQIRVWDIGVRLAHWLLVLAFAALYLWSRKVPLHYYAGYVMALVLLWRVAWGFFGRSAALFRNFLFGPRAIWAYMQQIRAGRAGYYASHNPLGSLMAFTLLTLLLANCALGLLLASAGQQLGPLADLVPADWEEALEAWHRGLAHLTAGCVVLHIAGVFWATRLHRENYVLAMLDGIKRVPRHARNVGEDMAAITRTSGPLRAWLLGNPLPGSLLLSLCLLGLVWGCIETLVVLTRDLPAY